LNPKKFVYEERHYQSQRSYLIEWRDSRLVMNTSMGGQLIQIKSPSWIEPADAGWVKLKRDILNLCLEPAIPEHEIMDGRGVKFWITFNTRLLKFNIVNLEFDRFEELRSILNNFTICSDYPEGLFNSPS
jgi:hypothetical protein